jgi:hypothetical protein
MHYFCITIRDAVANDMIGRISLPAMLFGGTGRAAKQHMSIPRILNMHPITEAPSAMY